jgi:hypothetical protein
MADDAVLMDITNAGALTYKFGLNSFLSNGFRLDIDDAAAGAYTAVYIAIRGPQVYCGDYLSNITTADVTSESAACGFTPKGIFIASALIGSYTNANDLKFTLGATSGLEATRTNSNVATAIGRENGVGTTDSNLTVSAIRCGILGDLEGGTTGEEHLKSFDTNGFTLYQSEATLDDLLYTYLAWGDAAATASTDDGCRAVCRGVNRGSLRGHI